MAKSVLAMSAMASLVGLFLLPGKTVISPAQACCVDFGAAAPPPPRPRTPTTYTPPAIARPPLVNPHPLTVHTWRVPLRWPPKGAAPPPAHPGQLPDWWPPGWPKPWDWWSAPGGGPDAGDGPPSPLQPKPVGGDPAPDPPPKPPRGYLQLERAIYKMFEEELYEDGVHADDALEFGCDKPNCVLHPIDESSWDQPPAPEPGEFESVAHDLQPPVSALQGNFGD